MRAWVTTEDHRLEFIEMPQPEPGPDEALVAVSAATVSRGDLSASRFSSAGRILGLEVVGTVTQAAADGSGPAEGTRVLGYCHRKLGAWAQAVAVDTALLVPVPEGLDDVQAVALPNSGLAALAGLRAGGSLLGTRVLVTGAAGGVGYLAVQLARKAGAEVTGMLGPSGQAGRLEKFSWLRTASADALDGTFDLVVDLVGGEALTKALSLVAPNGVVASLAQTAPETASVPHFWFATHPGARLVSVDNRQGQQANGQGRRNLEFLAALAANGDLDPGVTEVRNWSEAPELFAGVADRAVRGRAVMRVA